MALPQLNTATYELELPSTGETIKYRPFLVKEQKILMLAQESEDEKQIERAFADIISSCTFGKLNPYKIPLFDIEYIFLRLRGKSVGEKVTLNVLCPDDEKTRVDVDINLEDVGILMRGRMWLMAFHQGQFGKWNWILMIFAGAVLFLMSLSALISYALRKRKGDWGIPKVPASFKASYGVVILVGILCILLPLFGLSVILICIFALIGSFNKKKLQTQL